MEFDTRRLPAAPDDVAPDGSDVRVLVGLGRGGMAQFQLAPGRTSRGVAHRTVEEIWFVVSGRGEMWRKSGRREEVVDLSSGVSVSIPVGTQFQFRTVGDETLSIIGVTMPPWPGADEAYEVEGRWKSEL